MKVKKITVEFDNGATVNFEGDELETLQKVRSVLEFLDTAKNVMDLAGLKFLGTPNAPFPFGSACFGPNAVRAFQEDKDKQNKKKE